MMNWAEKMIENMKENGEIKEKEGEDKNTIKLNQADLNEIATIVISQLNNGNDVENNQNENEESEE